MCGPHKMAPQLSDIPISGTICVMMHSGWGTNHIDSHVHAHPPTHKHTQLFTLSSNLLLAMPLTGLFLGCGGKLENPEETHRETGRTCKETPHRQSPELRIKTWILEM